MPVITDSLTSTKLPFAQIVMDTANLKSLVDEWLRLDPVSHTSHTLNNLLTVVEPRNL